MTDPWLPYGRQSLDEEDIAAVVAVLRSDWLTTGPAVGAFERRFAELVGAREAVALSSGTAALHACMAALDIGPGDEVIVPTLTFTATANCVLYQGATPVFADIAPDTWLLDPNSAAALIGPRTRAIIAVDYAGTPCDYAALSALARRHGLALVADACHSLGARRHGKPVGTLADLTAFSFHPVKVITTGEGGMVTTADPALAERLRRFRHHGIAFPTQATTEYQPYEVAELGNNYRLTDIQSALGLSQLGKLSQFQARRRAIAAQYDAALPASLIRQARPADSEPAHHLYPVRVPERDRVFAALHARGIGANVHYPLLHLQPLYRERLGTRPGQCPVAERVFADLLSLPIYPAMNDADVARVVESVNGALNRPAAGG